LQAVIIAGDINVDQVEAKVKKLFSGIPAPVNPEPRGLEPVPDNSLPLVSIAKDREMTNTVLSVYYKHEKLPFALKGTIADVITGYSQSVISLIMSERFSEIVQKPDPPFVTAYADDGDYFISRTKDAWTSTAIVKPGELERAMNALVAETERARKFGFTQAEYERARDNILKSYESAYRDREKQQNSSFAEEYIRNFTEGEYIPGIEVEYELVKRIAPEFPLEGINGYVAGLFDEKDPEHNVAISLFGPDKEGLAYPSEMKLLDMFRAAYGAGVSAYAEEEVSKILLPVLPAPGRVVEERQDPRFGVTVYTLSNGVRAVVKKTDFKQDQVLVTATSPGGVSLFKDEKDTWNLKVINNAVMLGGLGEFSATGLQKAIAGKNVSCGAGIGVATESINGTASPSDLKTLLELIYLQFTGVRTDDEAYASFEERVKTQLDSRTLNPMTAFSDSLTEVVYNYNPRNSRLKSSDFDKVDYHRMIGMYRERYADASDFVFTFVGNVETDSLRPLLEQYLAALPSLNRKEKADESQVTPFRKGKVACHFSRELETPKSAVGLMYTGTMPYNLKNAVTVQLLSNVLDLVYMEKVREDESASYSIQVSAGLYDFPEGRTSIQIYFDTGPERQDDIIRIVKSELARIAEEGPRESDLKKSRESILKGREEIMQENNYWLDVIDTYYYRDYDMHTDYNRILDSVTADDLRIFVREFLGQGNEVEVVMSPAAGSTPPIAE
jgi:zinc protease